MTEFFGIIEYGIGTVILGGMVVGALCVGLLRWRWALPQRTLWQLAASYGGGILVGGILSLLLAVFAPVLWGGNALWALPGVLMGMVIGALVVLALPQPTTGAPWQLVAYAGGAIVLGGLLLGSCAQILGGGGPGTLTSPPGSEIATATFTPALSTATPTSEPPTLTPKPVVRKVTPTPTPPTATFTPTPTPSQAVLSGRIGDYVWIDADRDGLQGSDERGLGKVTVRLFDAGDSLVGTTSTNEDGYYWFSNVESGSYFLEFAAPAGSGFTTPDMGGDDEIDSDADPGTGRTITFDYEGGDGQLKWDAGVLIEKFSETATPTHTTTPTPTPTRWYVITPGECVVRATFSQGEGECDCWEGFEDTLKVTVSEDGTTVVIEQPSTGDRDVGTLNPDGSFEAVSEDGRERYWGNLFDICRFEGWNWYESIDGCACTWVVEWEPNTND